MIKIFVWIFCLSLAGWFYLRWFERSAVFVPSRVVDLSPEDIGLDYENIWLTSEDGGRVHGWFIPAERRPDEALTLLFLHGNAGSISGRLEKIRVFHNMGLNVLIIDYRGYGLSSGTPAEEGLYADARAAFDYLIKRGDIRPDRVIVYGVSLGGAPAVDLAVRRSPAALILESTFTSVPDMARHTFPFVPPFLVRTQMRSLDKIEKIAVPKLIIHSPYDDVVPYEMGRRLFGAAPHPKQFLKIMGDHNQGFYDSLRQIEGGIRAFLRQYFPEGYR
ncbi:MAG: alpha/beta hydrolase [Candidatus Omnitrophota bacterium]